MKFEGPTMGAMFALTGLFVCLKVAGLTKADWIWVFSPIWVVALVMFLLYALAYAVYIVRRGSSKNERDQKVP